MVRRSDHCLPSDSDKFTIKLHSLPSKFPSSALLRALPLSLSYSLASVLFRLCAVSAHPFCAAEASSLWTHGSSFGGAVLYSLAITITLYTPVPPSVSSSAPFALFHPCFGLLVLRAATFRLSSPPSVSSSLCLVSFLRFLSLPCSPPCPDRPVAPTAAIPQLFSTFLALVAIATRRGIPHAFRYHACFTGISLSLFFAFFISLVLLILSGATQLASISQPAAFTSRPSSLLSSSSSSSFPFIREMGDEIYEVKLMITTSKQRTERLRVSRAISLSSFSSYRFE